MSHPRKLSHALRRHAGPGSRAFAVMARVMTGVWRDGFIHAGNLAYMAILSIFPFFIVVGGIFSAVGEEHERAASVHAFLGAMPPVVSAVLEPVGRDVIIMRHGWFLWAGSAIGLWTVSSLIETIRDILRRAYGSALPGKAVLRYRLLASGMVMLSVVLLLASLYMQVVIAAALEVVRVDPQDLGGWAARLRLSRLLPMGVLFGALYMLYFALTPKAYRAARYPKWPGAALVTLWWGVVSIILPVMLRSLFKYDMTYGSLAGVMIALFFFWLVGLGMVTGAELNAALALSPEELDGLAHDGGRDSLGQADDRARMAQRAERLRDETE
jgi:membrane protein